MFIGINGNRGFIKRLSSIFHHSTKWKIAKLLQRMGFKINLGVGQIYLDKGWKGVKEAYVGDIRFVLKHVSALIKHIDEGRIIITTNHSNHLGEGGRLGHGGQKRQRGC